MSVDSLVKKLTAANLAYRNTEKLLMTDEEYDEGLEQLRALAPNHPLLTQIGADEAKSVPLPSKMASLDKVIYGEGALEKWKKKCVAGSYVVSEKLDGISCLYVSAGLTDRRLYLRGNGVKGVDVSGLIGKIKLEKLRTKNFIVRGELVLKKADTPKGSIGRSLINGWVHRLESASAELANVHFLAYQVIEPAGMKRRQEFEWLRQYFEIPWTRILANPMLTEEVAKNLLVEQRAASEYPTDGLVIATDSVPLASQEQDQGLKNPKDCIAFKAALDEQKRTTLVRGIEWNLSRQGFLIPTILIEPVVIGEANIERLSGHNAATILKHKLGPGARIIVRRSGDVIPTLDTVLEGCSIASMPVASWSWDENETHAVLTKIEGQETKEAKVKALVHALQTFEIPGVGEGVVEKMVEGGFDTMAKLWKASAGELAKAIGPGRGPKVVEALKAITPSEAKMLIASNLLPRGVGERKLAALFAIESDPRRWTVEKFDNVPGWGTASIDELLYALPAALEWGKFRGVAPLAKAAPLETQPTNGKSVVFTGVRDKVLEERLKAQGWEISPSVTKKTTVVVVADSWNGENSGKTQKAKEYGVRIMSISEFSTSN